MMDKRVFVTTKCQLDLIQLRRDQLGKLVNSSIFEPAVVGCFVRISVGSPNSRPQYRIAEVLDVCETTKAYELDWFGKSRKTKKGLKLLLGGQEIVYEMKFVSNQVFAHLEFKKWMNDCVKHQTSPPTLADVAYKVKDVEEAFTY